VATQAGIDKAASLTAFPPFTFRGEPIERVCMVLNKFPEIPDEDLWMFYEQVRRDGGTRLFDYWRSAIPHIVEEQYYRASLFAGRAPEGDKSKAILQYLENQGEDLFAWMHKEEPKPRFGRDPINNSNLDQIGLALVAYHNFDMANRPGPYVPEPIVPSNMPEPTYPAALMPVALNPQIQDQVIESKPWVPAPYWGDALGCTGGLGAKGTFRASIIRTQSLYTRNISSRPDLLKPRAELKGTMRRSYR
jgi:hypothetical protein